LRVKHEDMDSLLDDFEIANHPKTEKKKLNVGLTIEK
jgi:hypothetical protein